MKKKLLIFHRTIAPYRVDFFNTLYHSFETRICLQYKNLKNQKFDYEKISRQFEFKPYYLSKNSSMELCKWVLKQIKDFQPDIVIVNEYGLVALTALLARSFHKKEYRIVTSTDDSYDMVADGNSFSVRHSIARKLLASCMDDFIVIEPRVEQWYQQKFGKGVCFPIIVDDARATTNYEQILPISRQFVEHYKLAGKQVLLSVSRLVELKNLHRVIDAFTKAKTDAVFVIVGDGPECDSLKQRAKQISKEIIFTGRLEGDDLYAWYNLANVFVLASYQEPFGAVTNEALLAGCRVVVSKKAGSACLVDKTNGELIDPMNVEEIANAIDRQMQFTNMPDLMHARKNMMSISFQEGMKRLITKIQQL